MEYRITHIKELTVAPMSAVSGCVFAYAKNTVGSETFFGAEFFSMVFGYSLSPQRL